MKLRKLSLHNVRKFAGVTAVLGPFCDGLTTISAENESGKSTFFDALHALFFYDYGSGKKELKDLQPYSGGAMRISAEIELKGENYQVEKVFNLKKAGSTATITALSNGAILKQADDAEHWINQNVLNANDGPFGLLWVKQGTVKVDTDPNGIEARRDVMSSVRGQIDAVTGGRRMDAIVQRCKQDLDAMSTKQDKPKAGSAWKGAEDRVDILREEQTKLRGLVDALGQDLLLKRKVMARLKTLNAPDLRDMRAQAIEDTRQQLTEVQEHARKVQEADKDLQLLQAAEREITREMSHIERAQAQRDTIATQIATKAADEVQFAQVKAKAQTDIDKLHAEISRTETERTALNLKLAQLRQDERGRLKHQRLVTVASLLQNIQAPRETLKVAEKELRAPEISKAAITRLTHLERRRDIAIETRKVHFASYALHAETQRGQIDGADVPNAEPRLIDRPIALQLPGFGAIELRPAAGTGRDIEDPETLDATLGSELQSMGASSLKEAQAAHDKRQDALHQQQTALVQIRAIAPDGVDALTQEWADLCDALSHPDHDFAPQLPPQNSVSTTEKLESDLADLDATLLDLRGALPALQNDLASSAAALTEAEVLHKRLLSEAADLVAPTDEAEHLRALSEGQSAKADEIVAAKAIFETLQSAAPDVSAARAKHERAVQADAGDIKEINQSERDLARLNGAIHTQSEGAVEERLSEVTGKLERAQMRANQFAEHARSLKLLLQTLEAARSEAQATYFEPVRRQLLPLLRQLHVGADFEIDADKLLIETITRDGITDKVDVLSGGAYEQIAILTRLAFAKLFAENGNHVPIILDDALVHTDDERISTMFNLLAQIAQDQQIIVLSCRTRAFSDLGGERAFIVTGDQRDGL